MASLTTLSKEDLEDLHSSLWNTYKQEQTKDLHLNMSRGKSVLGTVGSFHGTAPISQILYTGGRH